jgi:hypothetical protein
MKVTVRVTLEADDDTSTVVHEVFTLERGALASDTLGLHLDEAKELLRAVQSAIVEEQVHGALAAQVACPDCGNARRHKDAREIVVRSLFGTLRLASPRWWHCSCAVHQTRTFSPLAALIAQRTTPELQYLEAKFAGLVSYGLSAKLLADILPLGRPLHAAAVRLHTQAVAQRLEDELGDERWSFTDGCPVAWKDLPRPDLPLVVGLDGAYVHCSEQRSRRDGWFDVIAGKSMPDHGPAKSFGFVQTYDAKPKRRLFEILAGQGMQANQHVTFITDGGDLPAAFDHQPLAAQRVLRRRHGHLPRQRCAQLMQSVRLVVPGRKTDRSDAEWLADVAAHGMIRPSFVAPLPVRELRELTRYRKTQIDARVAEIQRLEKVLQDAGVKLTSVASKVLTQSGRSMIQALIAGEQDPAKLAALAKGKMRPKMPALTEALAGHQRPDRRQRRPRTHALHRMRSRNEHQSLDIGAGTDATSSRSGSRAARPRGGRTGARGRSAGRCRQRPAAGRARPKARQEHRSRAASGDQARQQPSAARAKEQPVDVAALRARPGALGGDVEILDIEAQDLVGASSGLIEQPPQRALTQVDVAALPQPLEARERDAAGVVVLLGAL